MHPDVVRKVALKQQRNPQPGQIRWPLERVPAGSNEKRTSETRLETPTQMPPEVTPANPSPQGPDEGARDARATPESQSNGTRPTPTHRRPKTLRLWRDGRTVRKNPVPTRRTRWRAEGPRRILPSPGGFWLRTREPVHIYCCSAESISRVASRGAGNPFERPDGENFKLDDAYIQDYAEKAMRQEPDLKGFFSLRKTRRKERTDG